jgi:hypothetical protein
MGSVVRAIAGGVFSQSQNPKHAERAAGMARKIARTSGFSVDDPSRSAPGVRDP